MTRETDSEAAVPGDSGHRFAFAPDYAVLPGETLQETINALGISQRELASRTGLPLSHIRQIIAGVAPITKEVALALSRVTGVPSRLWRTLEVNYRKQ